MREDGRGRRARSILRTPFYHDICSFAPCSAGTSVAADAMSAALPPPDEAGKLSEAKETVKQQAYYMKRALVRAPRGQRHRCP